MTRRPPLRALAVFEAAARNGSFLAAAKELHITTSGVSHHIKALEGFLGTRLFDRLNRGVRLTLEGAAFYESIHEAYERIDEGTHRFRCRVQAPVAMLNFNTLDPEMRDPYHPNYFSDVYQANVLKTDEGWALTKEGGRNEMTQSRSRSTGDSQGGNP